MTLISSSISWKAKKQSIVSHSYREFEYCCMTKTTWVKMAQTITWWFEN